MWLSGFSRSVLLSLTELGSLAKNAVLVRVSITLVKHLGQQQLGEERIYFFFQLAIWEVVIGTQGRGGSCCRGHGVLLTGFFPWLDQPAFLYISGPAAQGWHQRQLAEPSNINHHVRKHTTQLLTGKSWGGFFFFLSQLRIPFPKCLYPVSSWHKAR